jgi:Tfp pilus assembly protein FimT
MSANPRWWAAEELRGELDALLNLVNAARSEARNDEERAARKFCDALNRAWNARARLSDDAPPDSDWPLVKGLVSSLPDEDGLALRSDDLRELVSIDPLMERLRQLVATHGNGFRFSEPS